MVNYKSCFQLFLLTLLLGTCRTLYGQGSLNQMDSLLRKQGHWIFYGKDRPSSGILPDGKVEEGNYVDDRKEGRWIKYHDDGKTPKIIGGYANNRPTGKYWKYWPNGSLREVGTFERNLQLDTLIRYFENGNMAYDAWFNEEGKEHGKVNYYYENGQISYTFNANNGIANGKAVHYWQNGDLKETIVYDADGEIISSVSHGPTHPLDSQEIEKRSDVPLPSVEEDSRFNKNNLPTGYHKIYNAAGEIWLDGIFKDGVLLEGKQYIYDSEGILLKVKVF